MGGGVCNCASLNGDPNDVIHYSAERVCRTFCGSREFSPNPSACSLIDAFLAPRWELYMRKTPLSAFEGHQTARLKKTFTHLKFPA